MRTQSRLPVALALIGVYSSIAFDAAAGVDYGWLLTTPEARPGLNGYATVAVSSPPVGQSGSMQGVNAINNSGMSSSAYLTDRHSVNRNQMWESNPNDPAPEFTIDLHRAHPIGKMLIWNYAAYINGWGYFSGRGVKEAYIHYTPDGFSWTKLQGPGTDGRFTFAMASTAFPPNSGCTLPPTAACDAQAIQRMDPASNLSGGLPVDFNGRPARYIRITPVTNWGGAAGETDKYYGLAEVRVYHYGGATAANSFISSRAPGTSSFAGDAYPENTVSNAGMSDATTGAFDNAATVGNNTSKWMTVNNDPNPYIMYDLGGTYPLKEVAIWNLNVNVWGSDLTTNGIKQADIWYNINNTYDVWKTPAENMTLGGWTKAATVTIPKAGGGATQARSALVAFPAAARGRYVVIIPKGGVGVGNHGGQAYGLSQVRFYAGTGLAAEPAMHWQSVFAQRSLYSTNPAQYAGDGTYSVKYTWNSAQRSLFVFDDPWYGTYNSTNWASATFSGSSHNGYAIFRGGPTATPALDNVTYQPNFNTQTIRPAQDLWPHDQFYWIQGGYEHNGALYLGAIRRESVPGVTGGVPRSFDIIRVPLDANGYPDYSTATGANNANNQKVTPFAIFPSSGTTYGFPSQMVKFGTQAYAYGWKVVNGADAQLIVARFDPAHWNLFTSASSWRFYNGTWTNNVVTNSTNILPAGASGVWGNVSATPTGWSTLPYMYTTSPKVSNLPQPIKIAFGANPQGPFNTYVTLAHPQPTLNAPYVDDDPTVYRQDGWYATSSHPELSPSGEALISTNLQPFAWPNEPILFPDATRSPMFFRVRKF